MEKNKYIVELIGTFFLVLTIALTTNPIAIGVVLIAMVYMGGYISGGHFNPAVSLAVFLQKKLSPKNLIFYIVAQVLGGMLASLTYAYVKANIFLPTPASGVTVITAGLIEAIYTFALAFVVLNVAVAKQSKGNQYYGLAIGLTIMAAAFSGGPISGGVFNPAVAVGAMLADANHLSANLQNLLLYTIAPFAGATIASFVYTIIHQDTK